MPLTRTQAEAVGATGNVIVVAGAGTGKTTTLVQRCLRIVSEGGSLDRLLMVTFTEAAAAEMRHRLRAELQSRMETEPHSDQAQHLAEQLAHVEAAQISTVHGFCFRVVRSHFHELGLDPELIVLDEHQARLVRQRVLDELMTACYEGTSPQDAAVQELVRTYAPTNDGPVRDWVINLHRYMQSLPDPGDWLERQQSRMTSHTPEGWEAWLCEAFESWQREWLPIVKAHAGVGNVDTCIQAMSRVDAVTRAQVARVAGAVATAGTSPWPRGTARSVRDAMARFFDDAAFLAAAAESDSLEADWRAIRPHVRALLDVTAEFTRRFTEAKRQLGGVDFSDLEQLTLRLFLQDGKPTPIAEEWRTRLDHVFVDECQDINGAQDAILSAISRDATEGNRFLVGDVKQSIYQFRLADPQIFRRYEKLWDADSGGGQRILLSDNFRSCPGILAFVNRLFGSLMRESFGGVEYEPLVCGQDDRGTAGPEVAVELHLLQTDRQSATAAHQTETETSDLTAAEQEARVVAARLAELRSSGATVRDPRTGGERAVEWSDVAVLMRSPAPRIEAYASAFHQAGIPVSVARPGFLTAVEVSDLISLLKVLDNPLQDIPLLAVLRSPLVGLSLDHLARIRAVSRERSFWHALKVFMEDGALQTPTVGEDNASGQERPGASRLDGQEDVGRPIEGDLFRDTTDHVASRAAEGSPDELAQRLRSFFQRVNRWREVVRQAGPAACLESVFGETGYDLYLAANARGEEQLSNVRRLLDLALQFDPYQRQGLYRFLRYLESLEETEDSREPAAVSTRNAVQLMSVHRSKGLEFPVVVLAGLGTSFNLQNLRSVVLLDREYGVAPKAMIPSRKGSYPTLPHWLAERRQSTQQLGEELRLLYVAMTRARDRLICTGTLRKSQQDRWGSDPRERVMDIELRNARCPLDWLVAWLPTVTQESDWADDRNGACNVMRWRVWASDDDMLRPPRPDPRQHGDERRAESNQAEWTSLLTRMTWSYPHAASTTEAAKTSVSALRSHAVELIDDDAERRFVDGPRRRRRAGAGASQPSAAERGTLHHRLLQYLHLEASLARDGLSDQLATMVDRGLFTQQEASMIDLGSIDAFWGSELGTRLRAASARVRREVPFTVRLEGGEVRRMLGQPSASSLEDEFVVVQGVVDLAVFQESEIWILDFKTDAISRGELRDRIEQYRPQVTLYAMALERIHRKCVRHRWLHFLGPGETVDLA